MACTQKHPRGIALLLFVRAPHAHNMPRTSPQTSPHPFSHGGSACQSIARAHPAPTGRLHHSCSAHVSGKKPRHGANRISLPGQGNKNPSYRGMRRIYAGARHPLVADRTNRRHSRPSIGQCACGKNTSIPGGPAPPVMRLDHLASTWGSA